MKTNPLRRARRQRGMTLIEIMVVVIILGTIASLVAINVMDRLKEANERTAKIQMSNFKQALDLFKLDNGFYPESEQGLQALVAAPTVGRQPRNYRASGYLKDGKVPDDPWGNPYGYVNQAGMVQIFSYGDDGQPGTPDDIAG
jgi:general secretion pathway protein G